MKHEMFLAIKKCLCKSNYESMRECVGMQNDSILSMPRFLFCFLSPENYFGLEAKKEKASSILIFSFPLLASSRISVGLS